jgi:hypothetical protein
VQEVLYEDSEQVPVKEQGIGEEPSLDSKVGLSNNYESGNTLNLPVPFLESNPILQNSAYSASITMSI